LLVFSTTLVRRTGFSCCPERYFLLLERLYSTDLDLELDWDLEVEEDHSWLLLACSEELEEEEELELEEDSSLLFSR